ncbi:MAG: hypothetical protein MK135_00465, partial [Polyangiaceae bacterium]|nr:hypothetical protein [Polyangiaceae bacterium]
MRRRKFDFGRAFAQLLCGIFALIGCIPLAGGVILRSDLLHKWAASETSRLLEKELGVQATFQAEMTLIPLRLAVNNLAIPSTDGGSPALSTERVSIAPRFFSLLAGQVDVGDIELENTKLRFVFTNGALQNAAFELPARDPNSPSPEFSQAPFRSIALTNLQLD